MRLRRPRLALAAPVLVLGVLVLGIFLGGHPESLPGFMRSWLTSEDTQLVHEAFSTIRSDYYRSVSRDQLLNGSIDGAVASLRDPYSTYYSPSAYRHYQQMSDAEFSGIGVDVRAVAGGLRIVRVLPHTPAEQAGLAAGELIVAVDGVSLRGVSVGTATRRIQGRSGTLVRLTVAHEGRRRTVRVRRATISVPVVEDDLRREHGIPLAHVALASFTTGAHGDLRQAVDRELHRGARGIVLDLRGNGGGLVEEAVLVASIFIPEGTVVATDGRTRARRVYTAAGDAISTAVPVVVLVDRETASAAEIVAGALQDHDRATIVGTHTYGKGVFQEVKQLPNGGALAITVGEYFTPDGHNLGGGGVRRGNGIRPDVEVRDDPATSRDEALDRALATLAAKVR